MPSFLCNARHFLITYAQCGDLSEWDVLDRFSELGAECIIAREYHADLGLHLHVFVDFGRKFRSRRVDIFDVAGRHPNIKRSYGTPEKGYDYAIKDGEVVAGGLERPDGTFGSGKSFDLWSQITGAGDREEFWKLLEELDPKSLCCSFTQLQKYADWRFAERPAVYESPGGFEFVSGDVDGRDQPLSLVLYGESRTGKTLWARSLGPHIYNVGLVSGEECMKASSVEYAIFDDIRGGIKFFPAFKEWLGGQQTVCVKRLYRDPKLIQWGKPSIWISNDDPRHSMETSDVAWLEMNCKFVEINTPIFRANTE
ncbi:replication associated protein [Lynx canadensis faeces associated genomovirus CL5 48]|uniref:Replication-associated protein n=1 Tax=Lynx canadensis faeces associated genomovirus CL5 48 TaxID=2219132 RepID=A0A2Z5CHK9_9VIRU|nr:replication associated protein [Lynx canadensis faeces associated genomovirus CL5 48]AXB22618.1 replication associated protein [Lynx canadensis faeces associated genomovirus CL5 48]